MAKEKRAGAEDIDSNVATEPRAARDENAPAGVSTQAPKRGRGRPSLGLECYAHVQMTRELHTRIESAARAASISIGEWMRRAAEARLDNK